MTDWGTIWGIAGAVADPLGQQLAKLEPEAQMSAIARALIGASDRQKVLLYYRLGCAAVVSGHIRDKAQEAFTLMHGLATQLHDKALESLALCGLSVVHDLIGQRQLSLECAQHAESLAERLGNQRLVALALNNQAQFFKETDRNPLAYSMFNRVALIGMRLGDERLVMGGHIGKGRATPIYDVEAATSHHEQAIMLAEKLGDRVALGICCNNLAEWKLYAGDATAAIALQEQSLAECQASGYRIGVGRALVGIARAETVLERPARAWPHLRKGLPLVLAMGDVEGEMHCFLTLAHLYVRKGDIPRACDYYQRVLARSLAAPDPLCAAFAQEGLEQLGRGELPQPGILPRVPVAFGVGAEAVGDDIYGTGDQHWTGLG
jgi:tetratricopeptide (TPR) repeat protein